MIVRLLGAFYSPSSEPETNSLASDANPSSYFTLYRDGFSVGDKSIRISNIPINIKSDIVFSYSLLLSIANLIIPTESIQCEQPYTGVTSHFLDQSGESDYVYHSWDNNFHYFHGQLKKGICGADPSISQCEISSNRIQIAKWTGGNTVYGERAYLYRGVGDPTNSTLEECIKELLTSFNNEFQKEIDTAAVEKDKSHAIFWGSFAAGVGALCLVGCAIFYLVDRVVHKQSNNHSNRQPINLELGTATDAEISEAAEDSSEPSNTQQTPKLA